jgi:hypothetical protein
MSSPGGQMAVIGVLAVKFFRFCRFFLVGRRLRVCLLTGARVRTAKCVSTACSLADEASRALFRKATNSRRSRVIASTIRMCAHTTSALSPVCTTLLRADRHLVGWTLVSRRLCVADEGKVPSEREPKGPGHRADMT